MAQHALHRALRERSSSRKHGALRVASPLRKDSARRKTRVLAPLVAVALLPLTGILAGCGIVGGGNAAAQAAPGPLETSVLNVAAVPSVDSAGFFVAMYAGLFKAQGLTIHYTPALSSDTVIDAQVAGRYDITAGNYVSYVQHEVFQHQQLDIVSEGSLMQQGSQAIYTLPNSPIKTLADLQGRRLGTNAPKNINYLLAASVLTEDGISPGAVKFTTQPAAFPDLITELAKHQVDAAALPEPFATMAEEQFGATALSDMNQGATHAFPILGYVVTKQWAQAHPNTLKAFLEALEEGQQIADTKRGEVETAMEKLTGTPGIIADVMAFNSYPIGVDLARLQRVPDVMFQFGVLPKPFNISQMLAP
jgi:NitT/TauT family transport system substrate-binding protein